MGSLCIQYLRQIAKAGKNGVKAKNQLIDFVGLSKRYFCQKWLKIQIGEGIVCISRWKYTPCRPQDRHPCSPRFADLNHEWWAIPHAFLPGSLAHPAVRNLLIGYALSLPAGQALARAMSIAPLREEELKHGNSSALNTLLDTSGFIRQTPLWYYILKESEVRDNGISLGDVGSRIIGETLWG